MNNQSITIFSGEGEVIIQAKGDIFDADKYCEVGRFAYLKFEDKKGIWAVPNEDSGEAISHIWSFIHHSHIKYKLPHTLQALALLMD